MAQHPADDATDRYVRDLVDAAPPLTPAQRDAIALALRTAPDAAA